MSSNSPNIRETDSGGRCTGANDLDVVMELLANHHRRYLLYCLRESDHPLTPEQLAGRIIDLDEHTTERDERAVLTELRHNHLPKMEAAGILERDGDTVRFDGAETRIESYLDLAVELELRESFS